MERYRPLSNINPDPIQQDGEVKESKPSSKYVGPVVLNVSRPNMDRPFDIDELSGIPRFLVRALWSGGNRAEKR